MGINWGKAGQFLIDLGLNSVEHNTKGIKNTIKENLKNKELTEEQRERLQEKLETYEDMEDRVQDMKYQYHSCYKDKY